MILAAIIEGNEVLKTKHIVPELRLPDHISKEILDEIRAAVKKNKKKKKKGKMGKMGKMGKKK